MISNIKSNTISEANAKKKIKEVETKGGRLIDSPKTLLSLFHDLKTIFNNNNNIVIIMRAIVIIKMRMRMTM